MARRERRIRIREGRLKGKGLRIGIIVSRFNSEITTLLFDSAVAALRKNGVRTRDMEAVRVPGAFEIPVAALRLARSSAFDGLVCLGAVIRGETPHFDLIGRVMSQGIARAMYETGIPIGFGVLTTETVQQALERADPRKLDRGGDAARTVIEMADLFRNLV